MEALFISIGLVALAEIGDKTQLLAFILAARFKKPIPIILGILFATLINHSLAGAIGVWIQTVLTADMLRWSIAILFMGMALWMLVPDKIESDQAITKTYLGVFSTTFVTFFLAEMGDKTQIATIALTAHYAAPFLVITGTTLGMLLADIPAVLIGNKLADRIPMGFVRGTAAIIFIVLGLVTLLFK